MGDPPHTWLRMTDGGFELRVESGKARGRVFALPADSGIVIGRDAGCDLVLDDPRASRMHARIEVSGDEVMLSDLGSHNGSFVNGERVGRTALEPSDRVRIGDHVFSVRRAKEPPSDGGLVETIVDPKTDSFKRSAAGGAPPKSIGRFEVLRKLAEGGMGTVFLGEPKGGGPKVAIKVLRNDFAGSEDLADRFEREMRLVSQLEHPHIIRHVESGRDGNLQYLVTEFVAGVSALSIVQEGPSPIDRALGWARQIASALEHAHERRILHRDLKPANVLIADVDGGVRILDFGLGRALDETGTRITFTGQSMGTVHYSSPEQLFDAKSVDVRTDVYGLGACLYAFTTGAPPIRAKLPVQAMKEIRAGAPRSPRELQPDLPEWLEKVILRAIARSPTDRYPDVASLRQALQG